MTPTKILRMPEVLERYGKKETAVRDAIDAGLFPRFVQLGGGCIGLPEQELEQIICARIAGFSDDEIKRLVIQIHEKRLADAVALRAELSL